MKLQTITPKLHPKEQWKVFGDFSKFRLSEETQKTLRKNGIDFLFQIQFETFNLVFEENDLIGRDRTGNGKTLAFTLPVLERLRQEKALGGKLPKVLIVQPTRELAIQTFQMVEKLKNSRDEFNVVEIYGGKNYQYQIDKLNNGVDVVVGTPGRLKDLIYKKHLVLKDIKVVVLDETDVMLDFGFEVEIKEIIKEITAQKDSDSPFQKLFFSATTPEKFVQIVKTYIDREGVFVDMVRNEEIQTSTTVQHKYVFIKDQSARLNTLKKILAKYLVSEDKQAIIFTNTKQQATELGSVDLGFSRQAIHGDVK